MYRQLMHWVGQEPIISRTVVVEISKSLAESNAGVCEKRNLYADLLREIAPVAAVTVVDSSFRKQCMDPDKDDLAKAMVELGKNRRRVVIGLSTPGLEDDALQQVRGSILKRLWSAVKEFTTERSDPENYIVPNSLPAGGTIQEASIFLPWDPRRVPLRWGTFTSAADLTHTTQLKTLATLAVQADNDVLFQQIDALTKLLDEDQALYVNFIGSGQWDKLHRRFTAEEIRSKPNSEVVEALRGKVVLIGEDDENDKHYSPVKNQNRMLGVYLHANYIEALQHASYLKALPYVYQFALATLIIFAYEFARWKWKKLSWGLALLLYICLAPIFVAVLLAHPLSGYWIDPMVLTLGFIVQQFLEFIRWLLEEPEPSPSEPTIMEPTISLR